MIPSTGARTLEKRREVQNNEPLPALSVMYHVSDALEAVRQLRNVLRQPAVFPAGPGRYWAISTASGLNPEKAKTYEVGTRYNDSVWGGEVTLFYIDFSDELQYVSNAVGWTNLGATKHSGIEASADYDLSNLDARLDGLTANAGFTYTKATAQGDVAFKGRDLPLYSREVATLGLRYDVNHWTDNLDVVRPVRPTCAGHRHHLHHPGHCRRSVRRYSRRCLGQRAKWL